jgi:superfamily II DNA/RNA helicase
MEIIFKVCCIEKWGCIRVCRIFFLLVILLTGQFHGAMGQGLRLKVRDEFEKDKSLRILIASKAAGGKHSFAN